MRRMVLPLFAALLLVALVFCTGCPIVSGSANLTTQDFPLANFSRVRAESSFKVEIVQGAPYAVKVTVNDNLKDYLRVSKNGDTLVLSVRSGYSYPNSTFRAQVTMPELKELKLSGASRAAVSGFTAGDNLNVSGSGASSASFINMQVGTLEVDFSGASSASGKIDAGGNSTMTLSGASSIELEGRAQDLLLEASGASQAKLGNFAVRDARVNLSGASLATVNASGTLSGGASGASHLRYRGSPTIGNFNTSGGSSINKE